MTARVRLLALLATILASSSMPVSAQDTRFDRSVAPVLIDRCIDCHSGRKPKGRLDLTRKSSLSKVVIAGKPADSVLWQRLETGEMPPKKPLPEAEKAVLKAWIEAGARWGTDPIDPLRVTTSKHAGYDWWSLQPVKRPPFPNVKRRDWPKNPIDHFILAKLEAEGLAPSPEADTTTLMRRAYFDLIGLPPAPEEVKRDAKSDHHQSLFCRTVNQLLASPRYGERWARHWLDVVRFGESHGFEHDELRSNAWPYRDWVIDAFNKDMPYDEFARLQLAGDVLQPDSPAAITATGFLVAGSYDSVGQGQQSAAMKAVVRQDELEDIVGTIGQTFLGLTVQCARCHDHKFDPVRSEDYYRLCAAVAGVRHGERDVTPVHIRQAFKNRRTEASRELARLRATLAKLEAPVRVQILSSRRKNGKRVTAELPRPLARWDFTKSLKDEISGLDAVLHDGASLRPDGLHLDGTRAYASTPALTKAVRAKTLIAVVRLANHSQRGGAAISLQSLDGSRFDALVFGEQEAGRWMAGSEFFRRTRGFGGNEETDARPVHVAITYGPDGTITGYRNGEPYGKPYQVMEQQAFEANQAMLLFGLRHSPPGANKHLAGTIMRAELYDRALSPVEVSASAGNGADYVTEEEIIHHMDATFLTHRRALLRSMTRATAVLEMSMPAERVYAVAPRAPEPTYLLIRGSTTDRGPLMTSGGVGVLMPAADFGLPPDAADAERRRKFAEWLTDSRNPLFARVLVNRLWHYHFGNGLVDTPSDFGFNGGRPSHPELLDWLADEFVKSGWSIKHMHRLIVTSATYRQASRHRSEAARRDANNRWLWRMSPRRLEAEALRDTILQVAGKLNFKQGGPGYRDFTVSIRGATYYYTPIDADDPTLYRRSIYRTWARSGRNGLLDVHDCPDPSTVSPRRALTTTPLQALSLLNNTFVLRMADRFAERIEKEVGADTGRQVARALELAYSRRARSDEIARLLPIVRQHGLGVLCRAIFNSNEFVYVD